jgi:2-polyprenyl-3-methyl-5-hydroxy-6-metoxy-1,4-benzoquinol methylase
MNEIFDNYIAGAYGERKQEQFKFKLFEHNYKNYFPSDLNASLLDIGVGKGEMLTCMKDWGYVNYQGIDISPDTIDFCQSLGHPCLKVEDVPQWLKKHEVRFDTIALLDVLEHVPKDSTVDLLKSIRASLVQNGTLLIQVPNMQAPDAQLHRYHDFTHEVGYTENSLRQVLLAAGFNNISFYGLEQFIFGGARETILKILRVAFRKYVKITRMINCNMSPKIINPVFYAVITK